MECATSDALAPAAFSLLMLGILILIVLWVIGYNLEKVSAIVKEIHTILKTIIPFFGILGTTDEATSRMDQASRAFLNQILNQNRRKK